MKGPKSDHSLRPHTISQPAEQEVDSGDGTWCPSAGTSPPLPPTSFQTSLSSPPTTFSFPVTREQYFFFFLENKKSNPRKFSIFCPRSFQSGRVIFRKQPEKKKCTREKNSKIQPEKKKNLPEKKMQILPEKMQKVPDKKKTKRKPKAKK